MNAIKAVLGPAQGKTQQLLVKPEETTTAPGTTVSTAPSAPPATSATPPASSAPPAPGTGGYLWSGLWIRIDFNPDLDPYPEFYLNPDPAF
jgi:hypothetical protein